MMIFIERRICRLLDRGKEAAPEAPSLSVDHTGTLTTKTTAAGAWSGTERLLDHDTSLPTDSDDGQPYATRLITPSPAEARGRCHVMPAGLGQDVGHVRRRGHRRWRTTRSIAVSTPRWRPTPRTR